MNPAERIDYIVRYLAGNNAREFAKATGIDPATISKLRNGGSNPPFYYARIAKAYPEVNAEWLEKGEGFPLNSMREKSEISERLDKIERMLTKISKTLERIAKTTAN